MKKQLLFEIARFLALTKSKKVKLLDLGELLLLVLVSDLATKNTMLPGA